MSIGSDVYSDVLQVLEELGEAFTGSRTTEGSYSTNTLTTATGSTTAYSGTGVPDFYKSFEIDSKTVLQGDSIFYCLTNTLPAVNDEITFNSKTYRVMNVESTRLTAVSVLYKLQLRV